MIPSSTGLAPCSSRRTLRATRPSRRASACASSRITAHFAGICHGGMLATALDIALGRSMAALIEGAHAPTVTLTIDFMRAAMQGDWLESRVRILRRTRSMIFCDTILTGPNGTVARANAVFKLPSAPRA